VLATGEMHSVRAFVELAFAQVNRVIEWSGTGDKEIGRCGRTGSCPKPWCSNGVLSRVGCSVRLPGMAS